MKLVDVLQLASGSLRGSRTRTLLMIVAMSIGVAAVVVLTALGEGARRYVIGQFSSLGSNLVIVLPGRSETAGVNPGMLLGQTARDIVVDDAEALLRSPAVRRIAPLTLGAGLAWRAQPRSDRAGFHGRLAADPPHGAGAGAVPAEYRYQYCHVGMCAGCKSQAGIVRFRNCAGRMAAHR
jgi:hypothetical protein